MGKKTIKVQRIEDVVKKEVEDKRKIVMMRYMINEEIMCAIEKIKETLYPFLLTNTEYNSFENFHMAILERVNFLPRNMTIWYFFPEGGNDKPTKIYTFNLDSMRPTINSPIQISPSKEAKDAINYFSSLINERENDRVIFRDYREN